MDAYARQILLDDTTGGFPELSVLLQQKGDFAMKKIISLLLAVMCLLTAVSAFAETAPATVTINAYNAEKVPCQPASLMAAVTALLTPVVATAVKIGRIRALQMPKKKQSKTPAAIRLTHLTSQCMVRRRTARNR